MKCLPSAVVILSVCLMMSVFMLNPSSPLAWAEAWGLESQKKGYSVVDESVPVGMKTARVTVDFVPSAADEEEEEEEMVEIADPIYYWNKGMYHFNDKLYCWVLKPVARGYGRVVPEGARAGIRNFFYNLAFPIRFVNCLLQAKGKAAAGELGRFLLNTTVGMFGLGNPAKEHAALNPPDEDLGQSFGRWRIGNGFYVVWPFLGPSTLRDSVGLVGDSFLDPVRYVKPMEASIGITAGDTVNETSFKIGDYEALKEAAIDPYISIRDAYVQHRKKKVEE